MRRRQAHATGYGKRVAATGGALYDLVRMIDQALQHATDGVHSPKEKEKVSNSLSSREDVSRKGEQDDHGHRSGEGAVSER